ncbi:hypothetical protein KJ934_01790 [Patescibacteria group bacterium]|nr:hypothetical protein [Patescibacteria group bacterium]MBU4353348.1 hypothetical protein [Patescibacteria group bacterium]MBU4477261.1 hypothetical protein [Patescibacteria group bacterium]MCG2699220.1 DUF5666 domain-containing protein [Candidatus Parcubacteria bacterium]
MAEEKNNKKFLKKIFENPDALKRVVIGSVGFAVAILIFGAGMAVGGMKAKFSYRWAENYHKNFGGPKGGFLRDWRNTPLMPEDFIDGHGAFGEIIEINPSGFVIKGRENVEKVIVATENTVVKSGKETITDGLKVGDSVTIIGSPNEQGQIEAKLIRVFDEENGARRPLPKR